jgi:hypothetical protein
MQFMSQLGPALEQMGLREPGALAALCRGAG